MKTILRILSFALAFCILCTSLVSCGYRKDNLTPGSGGGQSDGAMAALVTEDIYTTSDIEALVMSLDFGPDIEIEGVTTRYVSSEYLTELAYNSLSFYIWEVAAEAFDGLENEAWYLTLDNGIPSPVVLDRKELIAQNEAMTNPSAPNNSSMNNFLIGGGVILVCVAISVVGTPAVACVALSAAKTAFVGATIGAALYAGVGAVSYRVSEGSWEIPTEHLLDFASMGVRDGAIMGAISGALRPSVCFPKGTQLLSANGAVPIEEIAVGDLVWSWNEQTGETSLQPVTHTMTNITSEMTLLTLEGSKTLECTPDHPFYNPAKEKWMRAAELQAGDVLISADGEFVSVEAVAHRILDTPVPVHNISVDVSHTYFVTTEETSVLVHNSCAHQTTAWRAERTNYWKAQGELYKGQVNINTVSASGNYTLSQSNVSRMLSGRAPLGLDGKYVQLHHTTGIANNLTAYQEITATNHFANFKALHPWLFK